MILLQALLICVIFLTLFGLALWPVLFKNARHSKLAFLGANIALLIMLFSFGSYAGNTRRQHAERREQVRDVLVFAADALENGTRPQEAIPQISEEERDVSKVFEQTDRFIKRVKALAPVQTVKPAEAGK